MKLIAVIPARGGSKRIPRKNIRMLQGRPLLSYTIGAAREAGIFDRIIVSTDDPEIASVASEFGAEVPFLREASLADDFTPVSLVTLDALEKIDPKHERYSTVAQLMPNCPLRNSADILNSHRQFTENGRCAQISITRFGWQNPWWTFRRSPGFVLEPLFPQEISRRSQDLPELFCPTGAIWWCQTDLLRQQRTFHSSARTGWEIPWQRGIDIDTEEDWLMADLLLRVAEETRVR